MEQNTSATSRFFKGMFSGFKTSALMMTLYIGLVVAGAALGGISGIVPAIDGTAFTLADAFMKALPVAGLGIAVTSLFGGVNSVLTPEQEPQRVTINGREAIMRSGHIAQAPVVAMPIAMEQSTQTSQQPTTDNSITRRTDWAERTGGKRSDRIGSILADPALNDQSRVAALLAERERNASAQNTIA